MKCPMCESGDLIHEERDKQHLYICNECPFVGTEVYDTNILEKSNGWEDTKQRLELHRDLLLDKLMDTLYSLEDIEGYVNSSKTSKLINAIQVALKEEN